MITNDDLLGMCDELDDPDSVSLTACEAEFRDRVKKTLQQGCKLSSSDEAKLVTLWDRKCGDD
jgi:hypothetical protein